MDRHVHQRFLVVLPVDFDQRLPQFFERRHRHRLIVDETARFAIGAKCTADDYRVGIIKLEFLQNRAGVIVFGNIELGGNRCLRFAFTHERRIGTRAEHQP